MKTLTQEEILKRIREADFEECSRPVKWIDIRSAFYHIASGDVPVMRDGWYYWEQEKDDE